MPLSNLRVVELGTIPAGSYCGRIFADFGADVVKIEGPEGDPVRRFPPMIDIGAGERESAYFAFLNVRKRSVIIDPHRASSLSELHSLLVEADILIDSLSKVERRLFGIDHDLLRRENSSLVVIAVSWFGEDGPYSGFHATDSVCRAMAGLVKLIGPENGPPIPIHDYQAAIVGGLTTFIAAMSAMPYRGIDGGRRFEVSVLEANIAIADYNVALAWGVGERHKRLGINRFAPNYPMGIFPCKQGWIGITVVTPVQWKIFCELLGMEDLGTDPRYAVNRGRLESADELEARYKARFLEKTAEEWFELALEHKLPFVVVPDMAGVLDNEEHRRRDVFERIEQGERIYEAPGSPLRLTRTPPRHGGKVPRPGNGKASWECERVPALSTPTAHERHAGALPLEGIRIIDLSMGWAGPNATRHFADLGADVIKVEACQYPDWWRGVDNRPIVFEQFLYEKSSYFNVMNRNKRCLTLDLTTPDGVSLIKQLAKDADIVIDNYSAGVLPKLGLDYENLRKVNENLIVLSMPAFPADGKWRECRAYGSTLEQAAGIPSISGRPDDPPMMNHIAFGDPVNGMNAAAALLIAIFALRRTRKGQFIDLSQVECLLPMVVPAILEQSVNGNVAPRLGTRHPLYVPHGSFRCNGEDEWVLIAVTSDREWISLCRAIAREDLADDAGLSTAEGRRVHEEKIEHAIERWTRRLEPAKAMRLLQEAGVPAGVVPSPLDLLDDPHLKERNFWQWIERPFVGLHPQPSPAYREGGMPYKIVRPTPTLGQHNEEILTSLLKLPRKEIDRLEQAVIIGTKALPPSMRKARAATGRP